MRGVFFREGMADSPRQPTLIALALLATLAALVYWPGLAGGYVFDDFPNLVRNDRTILDSLAPRELLSAALASDAGPLKRPLVMLSLSLERYFFGLDPFVMKLTNLVIHLLNGVLIFLLTARLLAQYADRFGGRLLVPTQWLALLLAAAWWLAPINLTGVLFVIQRMESLATLFMLAGLLAYVHGRLRLQAGRRKALRWMWGGIVGGGALGVLAKEIAVMLPLYALLVEWLFFGFGEPSSGHRPRAVQAALWRLFTVTLLIPGLLGLLWLAPRVLGSPEFANRSYDVFERLWTEARVLWHYLAWITVPDPSALSLYHDRFPISRGPLSPWTTLVAALGLLGLIGAAVLLRRRLRLVAFGVLWFFIMHLLVSTVLNLELVYEHRNYLASLGPLLALLALLLDGRVQEMAFLRRFTVVALIVLYGFFTFLRASEWGDPLRLAHAEAARQPDSPRAQYELGYQLMSRAPPPDSPPFDLAIQTWQKAAALPNTTLFPWQGLILEHARHGLPIDPAWWAGMVDYVSTRPLTAQDRNALYMLTQAPTKGDIPVPVEPLRRVIEAARAANPGNFRVLVIHANFLLNVAREYRDGGRLLYRAAAMRPRNPQRWQDLIRYQLASGQLEYAAASLERLAAVNRLGRYDEAIAELREQLAQRRSRGEPQ